MYSVNNVRPQCLEVHKSIAICNLSKFQLRLHPYTKYKQSNPFYGILGQINGTIDISSTNSNLPTPICIPSTPDIILMIENMKYNYTG